MPALLERSVRAAYGRTSRVARRVVRTTFVLRGDALIVLRMTPDLHAYTLPWNEMWWRAWPAPDYCVVDAWVPGRPSFFLRVPPDLARQLPPDRRAD